jgi:ABC-type antimicrobial peptide transport system permease subunit
MGLGALLIGGVGIINTMLVMVGRRTMEIASFKTFGLKGGQISALFLAEAFLLGILGSIVGCILGILLTGAVNAYGEAFLQQRLAWRIYPEALWYGVGLGMVVTMVFGLLPVLTANRVRPAIILRPNEAVIPGAGIFHSLLVLALVVIVIGGIAGRIVGNVWVGMIGVGITLIIMGLLVGQMWLIVWLVGKLPSFGSVDFKLALRNMTARRLRTATTLLALSGGMFALSSITFFGFGAREILNFQLVNQLGGNVLTFPFASFLSGEMAENSVNEQLQDVEGVVYRTEVSSYTGDILEVNGAPAELTLPLMDMAVFDDDEDELPSGAQRQIDRIRESNIFISLQMRTSNNPNLSSGAIIAGRDFTPEDQGERRLVASEGFITQGLGLQPGDLLSVRIGRRGEAQVYELIGITSSPSVFGGTGSFYLAPGAASADQSSFTFYTIQVEDAQLNNALLALSTNPLNFALDVRFIDGLLARFIAQFSAIPTVVGLLSLLAAAVTMANTVSLAVLERRRQIGILKTVGLRSDRVLWVILLENTLIGLLGGLLGIGLSVLGVSLMTQLASGETIPFPREAAPIALFLLLAAILIAWAATFLSAAPVAQERVTSVLRYE